MSNEQSSLLAGTMRRQEDSHSESDCFFATLSQISTVGIFRTDVHGNCVYVNERWCKITGMKQGEALGKGWVRSIHPNDRDKVAQAWYTSKHAQLNFIMEYRVQRPDSAVRWVLGQATAERNHAGGLPGYIGTITDVTDHKMSEERLQQSEEKLRAYLDNISDTIWKIDANLGVAYVSPSVRRLLGIVPEELIGRPSALVIHPDDMDIINDAMRYVMEHPGEPHTIQYRVSHKDGRWIHVESTGVNLLANPAISGVLVAMRDITGRKQMETELRHSEETLNLAQTVAQVGSWYLDIPADQLEWSQETYRLFGIPQQEAINLETFVAAIHPDDRDSVLEAWGEAMAGAPYDIEHRIVTGGQVRWVRERARIARDSSGTPLSGIGTVQDITDRKMAENRLAENENRFREIFNTVGDAIFIHDAETGHIVDVNRRMLEMYGLTYEQALGCAPGDLGTGTPPYSSADALEKIHLARTAGPQTFVWLARTRNGRHFWVEKSLQYALIGSQQRVLATVRDITERKKAEEALQESEYRWKFALEGSGDGLWDWNLADNTVFYSRRWKEMLGYAEDEIGSSPEEWEKRIHPDDKTETLASMQAYLGGSTPIYQSEHRVCCKDGNWKWVLDRGMVVRRDEGGKPLRMVGTHADITERKQAEEQIHNLAYYDTLTQLPNRRMLNDRMNQAMASSKRSGNYCALLFLDLDKFKPLNDTYGHEVGDLLLTEVARRISNCVREMDTVARFGGDEFVVMLTELDPDKSESAAQARNVAEKIRIALAETYVLKVRQEDKAELTAEHHCTSSIGVVLFINHEAGAEDIIKWADLAMYQAKDDGRNLIRFHDSRV